MVYTSGGEGPCSSMLQILIAHIPDVSQSGMCCSQVGLEMAQVPPWFGWGDHFNMFRRSFSILPSSVFWQDVLEAFVESPLFWTSFWHVLMHGSNTSQRRQLIACNKNSVVKPDVDFP